MKAFSEIFIRRPVATILLSFAVIFAGLFGLMQLPVSPLPQLDVPVIFVSASIPGADAETMAATVATPLERSLGKISGVSDIFSTSSQGNSRVVLQFDLNRDINGAARDVQAGINAAMPLLPTTLRSNPVYRKINPADIPVMILSLSSDILDSGQLYDLASTTVAQRLAQIPGVGDVSITGSSLPAIRVTLDPNLLASQGITMTEVGETIANANRVRPKGMVAQNDVNWLLDLNDKGLSAADFSPLIIQNNQGVNVRLEDIAKVYDAIENPRTIGRAGAMPSVSIAVTRSANANIIETVDRIKEVIPSINEKLPAVTSLDIMLDRSPGIRASIQAVQYTLIISVVLVVLVVYLFLGSAQSTLIPAVTIPISLIGTFFLMYQLGFSLNNLSLMALVISTGFVVDDAIVVLENATTHIEKGLSALDAALKSAQEVGFTVLSMSLSLAAVFIPFLFMSDILGRLFLEFAATLTATILLSLLVSLTTTPMMCAYLLKPHGSKTPGPNRLIRGFNKLLFFLLAGYNKSLAWSLIHTRLVLLTLPLALVLMGVLFVTLPKGFIPTQDMGAIQVRLRIDQNSSFSVLQSKFLHYMDVLQADPAVDKVLGTAGSSGFGSNNSAQFYLTLKEDRQEGVLDVINRLRRQAQQIEVGQLSFVPIQDFPGQGGRSASAANQYTLKSDSLAALREWEPKLRVAMSQASEFVDVDSDLEGKGVETYIEYDRDAMTNYGLTVSQVNRSLYSAFGQGGVSTIYADRNQYKVVLELSDAWHQNPTALDDIVFKNLSGKNVPLSAFARWSPRNTPASVNHTGSFASVTIAYNLADGVSLDQGLAKIDELMVEIGMPSDIFGSSEGTAKLFQQGQSQQFIILLSAIIGMYLILGILYESYIHPITILSTLPSAGLGALIALWLFNLEFSLVAMISILLLIGIVKKNAIMMIDFAINAERQEGLTPKEAIYQACLQRFRPILMTTMAAVLGAIPLAFGSGPGSELRQPLGVAVVGGLLVSQVLTLYTTPVIYLYLDRLVNWLKRILRFKKDYV